MISTAIAQRAQHHAWPVTAHTYKNPAATPARKTTNSSHIADTPVLRIRGSTRSQSTYPIELPLFRSSGRKPSSSTRHNVPTASYVRYCPTSFAKIFGAPAISSYATQLHDNGRGCWTCFGPPWSCLPLSSDLFGGISSLIVHRIAK